MQIIVCIKQVPGTNKVAIDESTGVLKRDGVESKINPYDLYALEAGLRLREALGGTVTVVSMGPPQAEAVIREAYMLGADAGALISDRQFAGSDVLATSYTLSQGIRALGPFDLIICGKQTTDGDTAQVGPALAEFLNIPHVTWVRAIPEATPERLRVEQDLADSYELVELAYPCLITVEKGINQPRLPSYRRKLATADRPVRMIGRRELQDQDELRYGLNGSPTQVERIFPPEVRSEQVLWEGEAPELTAKLWQLLREAKYI
ncbi:electron transfer flavoprotein beta subunit [Hydrogenispora ethanolica]|jgi:electron transfer flavoprotein beta subunit|uniref:Electron transfer flavoprotein small subunit n=1 Tax=Hydrogenispora ethanolica TaxID=1082276 RepID=A0A4R1SCU3_HYDET|nr:electron transfer flavoprotein subunit beta/FixA family protein [Hydrogenispora ethanolica]TCL76850.1 electron transfer flavoprotein beta subunit [Hydrogenispora ethanolica]